jgi:hypothetical protein
MRFIGGTVGAGQQDRDQGRAQRRKTFTAQCSTKEQAEDGIFDDVQRLVPHQPGDDGHRIGLRGHLEDRRHVEQRREPEKHTTHSTLCA